MSAAGSTAIVQKYCERYPIELTAFGKTVEAACLRGRVDGGAVSRALADAHRMCGSAQCMGFRTVGTLMMQIEKLLMHVAQSAPAERTQAIIGIEQILTALVRQMHLVTPANSLLLRNEGGGTSGDASILENQKILHQQFILFVDDDPSLRYMIQDILQSVDVGRASSVANGKEALEFMARNSPTLIISDWRMQPIDGLELLQRVRSGQTSAKFDLPFIFLTAQKEVGNVRRVIRGGADHFLIKPFTRDVLIRALIKVVTRPRTVGAQATKERPKVH